MVGLELGDVEACPRALDVLNATLEAGDADLEIIAGNLGTELDRCRLRDAIHYYAATGDWPSGFDPASEGLVVRPR